MSKLSKFLGKSKTIEIDGEKIEIKPLTVKNLDVMLELGTEGKSVKALRDLVKLTLQMAKGFEDVTDEEIIKLPLAHYRTIIDVVMDINNMSPSEKELKKLEQRTFGEKTIKDGPKAKS